MSVENSQELTRLAKTIRERFTDYDQGVIKTQQIGMATVQAGLECGQALIAAKKIVGHGNWLTWLQKHCRVGKPPKPISNQYAGRLMKLANSQHSGNFNTCKSVRQAFLLAGIIPEDEPVPASPPTQPDTVLTPTLRNELKSAVGMTQSKDELEALLDGIESYISKKPEDERPRLRAQIRERFKESV